MLIRMDGLGGNSFHSGLFLIVEGLGNGGKLMAGTVTFFERGF